MKSECSNNGYGLTAIPFSCLYKRSSCKITHHGLPIPFTSHVINRWNQSTFKESNDKIVPKLDELHESIHRIAFDINTRMVTLQSLVESTTKHEHIQTLTNLRNCVQSAASVVSSASTALGIDHADQFSVAYGSEFGDYFPPQSSETMLRWVSSNTVYEFDEDLL